MDRADGRVEALTAAGWRQRTLRGFADRLGPLWTRQEDGGRAYGVLCMPEHLNPAGFVHGGALCALFDHMVSTLAWEAVGRRPCVTVQLNTQFLAPAREGDFLEARGRVVKTTATLVFMEGTIIADVRDLLAGSGVLKIMGPAPNPGT